MNTGDVGRIRESHPRRNPAYLYPASATKCHLTGITCTRDLLGLLHIIETPGWRLGPRALRTRPAGRRSRRIDG